MPFTLLLILFIKLTASIPLIIPPECVTPSTPINNCCMNLTQTYASSCEIFQCQPNPIGSNNSVSILVLRRCNLTSAIPIELTQITSLEHLDLSYNTLVGGIPESINNSINLKHLDLSHNTLIGHAGKRFYGLNQLAYLDLSWNGFGYFFPDLVELPALQHLSLAHNSIAAILGADFAHLVSLFSLDLSFNKFEGSLPDAIFVQSQFQFLNLANNNFRGTLPTFGPDVKMSYIDLANNAFAGTIPDYSKYVNLLQLNLGGNELSCPVTDYSGWAQRTDWGNSSYGSGGTDNCFWPVAPSSGDKKKPSTKLDGVEIFLIVLLIVFVCGLGFYCYRQHNDPSKYITLTEDNTL